MDLMERVKAECEKHEDGCLGCSLHTEGGCLCMDRTPNLWDIEEIRKALGEEQKEEIVVPKKIEMSSIAMPTPVENAIKINQIINCLEQIKEKMK